MLRRLSIGLVASAIALAPLPTKAQDGTAEDLGDVMSISLKDVVMTTLADQCALRVANAGSGVFGWLGDAANDPLAVAPLENKLWFDELYEATVIRLWNLAALIWEQLNEMLLFARDIFVALARALSLSLIHI